MRILVAATTLLAAASALVPSVRSPDSDKSTGLRIRDDAVDSLPPTEEERRAFCGMCRILINKCVRPRPAGQAAISDRDTPDLGPVIRDDALDVASAAPGLDFLDSIQAGPGRFGCTVCRIGINTCRGVKHQSVPFCRKLVCTNKPEWCAGCCGSDCPSRDGWYEPDCENLKEPLVTDRDGPDVDTVHVDAREAGFTNVAARQVDKLKVNTSETDLADLDSTHAGPLGFDHARCDKCRRLILACKKGVPLKLSDGFCKEFVCKKEGALCNGCCSTNCEFGLYPPHEPDCDSHPLVSKLDSPEVATRDADASHLDNSEDGTSVLGAAEVDTQKAKSSATDLAELDSTEAGPSGFDHARCNKCRAHILICHHMQSLRFNFRLTLDTCKEQTCKSMGKDCNGCCSTNCDWGIMHPPHEPDCDSHTFGSTVIDQGALPEIVAAEDKAVKIARSELEPSMPAPGEDQAVWCPICLGLIKHCIKTEHPMQPDIWTPPINREKYCKEKMCKNKKDYCAGCPKTDCPLIDAQSDLNDRSPALDSGIEKRESPGVELLGSEASQPDVSMTDEHAPVYCEFCRSAIATCMKREHGNVAFCQAIACAQRRDPFRCAGCCHSNCPADASGWHEPNCKRMSQFSMLAARDLPEIGASGEEVPDSLSELTEHSKRTLLCERCRTHIIKCALESEVFKTYDECRKYNCEKSPNMCGGCCKTNCPHARGWKEQC